ncbi:MAG: hypothetical protein ACOH1L_10205 [Thermomonas sp.]
MKTRHVYSTPDLITVAAAMAAARGAGIEDTDLLLVARSDIELESIPDARKEADTDMMPAAVRGAGIGGAAGVLAGLVAVAVPAVGITLAGAAAIGFAGAMLGTWTSALMGSSLPDPIRVKFEDEIEAGRILLLVDGSEQALADAEPAILRTGATSLPFDSLAIMS